MLLMFINELLQEEHKLDILIIQTPQAGFLYVFVLNYHTTCDLLIIQF